MAYSAIANDDTYASGASTTQAFAGVNTTAGDLLVVLVLSTTASGTHSVSDGTNTLTKVGSEFNSGSGLFGSLHYLQNITGGSITLTTTFSASSSGRTLAYWLFRGAGATVQTSKYTGPTEVTGADALSTGNLTPTAQPALLFGVCIDNNLAPTITSGSGFSSRGQLTQRNSGAGDTSNSEDKRLTATSVVPVTWTLGSAGASNVWTGALIFSELLTIDTQPQNVTVWEGQTATFTVSATAASGSLSYQWQLDSGGGFSNIGGATSSSYTTGTLVYADSGKRYRCNVTDSNGTITSSAATLTVLMAGKIHYLKA